MKTAMWVIIKKEMLVAVRSSRWQNLVSILGVVVLQCSMMHRFVKPPAKAFGHLPDMGNAINMGAAMILLYVAPMVIPFMATSFLVRSFSFERGNGELAPILATGVDAGFLWALKTLAIFAYCYAFALVVMLLDTLILTVYFRLPLSLPFTTVCLATIVSPVAALAVTAIMSFMYWIVRVGSMVANILPMTIIMGLISLSRSHPTTMVMVKMVMIVTAAAGSLLGVCAWIISRVSKARLLGM